MFVEKTGYIVSRHTRDVSGYIEMSLFIKTPEGTVKVLPDRQLSVFFTDAPLDSLPADVTGVQCSEHALKSFNNEPVVLVQSTSLMLHQQMINLVKRNGFSVFEEDIKAHNRYLMERNIRGAVRFIGVPDSSNQTFRQARVIAGDWQPDWNVWSLDIETSVSTNTLLSIGITSRDQRVAFVVTNQEISSPIIRRFSDEKSLLLAFIRYVKKYSPDIFIGWNLIGFDLQFIDQRCQILGIRPAFGVNGENWNIRSSDNQGKYFASIPGRVALDGITLLKVGGYHFESYSLNNVSNEILDDGKLLHGSERWQDIERLHKEDLDAFVAYNLQDCDLVMRIFEKLKLIELQQTRVDLTGIPLEQTGGSVAAFENLYLPRLHSAGWVAPAWSDDDFVASPGGFVMSSIPGLYKNVLVFDFKSLYPSIIRTFHVDPLARITAQHSASLVQDKTSASQLVPGFLGAYFDRQQAILPSLVGELAQAREEAKRVGNGILSYAIKIIMNSFYGVLGSNVCRFYHAELASSITMRGHELLGRTQAWMEERGARVIYGDTDSLFVTLNNEQEDPQNLGERLRDDINTCLSNWCKEYAQLDSHLELEFERVYERFFMPTIRGQEEGSKKRYAGKSNGELVFKGLEAARTDWTPLARQFQRTLFEKVFSDENPICYIQETIAKLRAGDYDDQLVYSKQLSRPLSSYTKNKPPHVRAAAMIDQKRAEQGLPLEYNKGRKRVYYLYQRSGVVPYESPENLIDLDYEHYIEKQIEPIADSILPFFKTNMASLLSQQISLL
ncbi:DNA polymerase II [Marinomonas sp. BSi20584]|uniref:DNA polymerase II n=1 Tax=Marinomonas sp. BSi20584 TaxID=1594462 RepID=UPI000C1E9F81|nr:DNA polymerase II [Marinomonas sp. BSi20584]PJE56984.1 DNA polymerase II [Marinomonas sp. BSi20584]